MIKLKIYPKDASFSIFTNETMTGLHQQTEEGETICSSQQIQKSFSQNQQPFVMKTVYKVDTEETYLNIVKALIHQPTANINYSQR